MESMSTLLATFHQRKSSSPSSSMAKKPPKRMKKSKPIKVKYISNPMKVETCASKFRELVQELTGQDAADQPSETFSLATEDSSPVPDSASVEHPMAEAQDDQEPFDGMDQVPYYIEPSDEDVFVPQMWESFSGCFTSGFYNVQALGNID